MEITKNSLRSFFSKRIQAILAISLVVLGTCFYTTITIQNEIMYESVTRYDTSQNVEDYGFIPRLNLAEEQWDKIFSDYNISENDISRFRNGELDENTIITQYNVNLYEYQKDFIAQVEAQYDLTVETSFNKMLADETSGHEYLVFADSGSINTPYVVEGHLPVTDNELSILPEYAKYNDLKIGGSLEINGIVYTISGFVYHPANSYPIVTSNVVKETSVYYPETQSILFMTVDGLNNLEGRANFAYKSINNQELTVAERNTNYHQLYNSNAFEILNNSLDSISHGEVYIRVTGLSVISLALVVVLGLACLFIVMQVISRRIDSDKSQIGVLKALGYRTWEIASSYCTFAVVISLLGSSIGYVLGQLLYRPFLNAIYVDYNLPIVDLPINITSLLATFAIPLLCFVAVSLSVALLNLRKPPLELIKNNANSKVNSLGKFVARIFARASFEIRAKYQIACRSISKLTAMLVIGFCASTILLGALILSTAFGDMISKTFEGISADNIVIFKTYKNINEESPQYDDEEISLAKDFFIQEIIYQNGNTEILDDTNKISTETIGILPNSEYAHLSNEKGESLNDILPSGLVINKVIQGKYGLKVGDSLTISNPHENVEVTLEIVGISDEYSGYLMYTDLEKLSGIFGYPDGTYGSVITNHQYQLFDSQIDKILTLASAKDGLKGNLRSFEMIAQVILVVAALIAFAVILILANLVIEENSKNISTFKVLGYSSREISNLVVNTYTPVIVIGYLLGLPASLILMNQIKIYLETKFDTSMIVSLNPFTTTLAFVILMGIYYIGLRLSRRNIDKIVLAESLKFDE